MLLALQKLRANTNHKTTRPHFKIVRIWHQLACHRSLALQGFVDLWCTLSLIDLYKTDQQTYHLLMTNQQCYNAVILNVVKVNKYV